MKIRRWTFQALLMFGLLPLVAACTDAKVKTFFKNLSKMNQGPYLRLEIEGAWVSNSSKGLLTKNHCHPAKLKIYKNSQPYNYDGSVPLNVIWANPSWGTIYNESSCGSAETSVSIAVGSYESTQLYVKSVNITTDQSFNFTLSDSAIGYESSHNLFDIANPKLKAYLPSRVVYGTGVCYWGRVERQLASGWQYSPAIGLTVSMTTNVSWNIGDSACGSNSGSANIAPSISSANFQFNPLSTGPYAVVFSAPGYDSDTLIINSGSGQSLVDHFEVVPSRIPTVGECIGLTIRLLNYDHAAITSSSSVQILVQPDVFGNGLFYYDGNCSTSTTSMISVPAGQSEIMIGYRPLRLTHDLKFIHPYYYLSGGSNLLNLTVNPNLGGIYLNANLPSFNGKKKIGSHEFGSQQLIPLDFPAGATLTCSTDYGANYNSCGTWVDVLNNFVWPVAVALSGSTQVWIKASNIFGEQVFKFNQIDLYGSDFSVIDCEQTISAGMSLSALQTEFVSYDRICLNSGVTITRSSFFEQLIFNGSYDLNLIGHSDGTSTIDSAGFSSASPSVKFTSNVDGTTLLANLKWIGIGSDTVGLHFDSFMYPAGYAYIYVFDNHFLNVQGKAIVVDSQDPDPSFYLKNNYFLINPNASGTSGVVEFAGVYLNAQYNQIDNYFYSSATDSSFGFKVIAPSSQNQNIQIDYLRWQGQASSMGIQITGDSDTYYSHLQLSNSYFSSGAAYGFNHTKPLSVFDANFNLDTVAFVDMPAQAGNNIQMKLKNNYSNNTNGTIQNSIFKLGTNMGMQIFFASGTQQNINITSFNSNQFIRDSSPLLDFSTDEPIDDTYMGANTYISSSGLNNLFCSSSSYIWGNLLSSLSNLGSWNYSNANTKCKKANNVSPLGLCKSLCDP